MKKIIFFVMIGFNICQAQFVDKEYTQFGLWNDPVVTFKEGSPQFGIDITKVMLWGWASLSLSHAALTPGYTDIVGSGGLNFHLLKFEPVRYYAGPRMGFLFRDGRGFPLVGGVIGFDWRLSRWNAKTKFHIGPRLYLDYREDQKNDFYGDSDAYEPGLITNNPLLQENGAIVLSWSW